MLNKPYSVGTINQPVRLHLNEFRENHHPDIIKHIKQYINQCGETLLTNYSLSQDPLVVDRISSYVGFPSDNILLTSGSDNALEAIVNASHLMGYTKIIMGRPSYTHFEHFVFLKQMSILPYFLNLSTTNSDHYDMIKYYSDEMKKGCIVYICSPNNPTGHIFDRMMLVKLIQKYPRSLFIIDETYIEIASIHYKYIMNTKIIHNMGNPNINSSNFKEDINLLSSKNLVKKHGNIVVVRSMSKMFGLASIRIGYIIGQKKILDVINWGVSPSSFNRLNTAVVPFVLDHLDYYVILMIKCLSRKALLVCQLSGLGWKVFDTSSNFYLLYVDNCSEFVKTMESNGILVRDRNELCGLQGHVRITAGNINDTTILLSTIKKITPPNSVSIQNYYTDKKHITKLKILTRIVAKILHNNNVEFWAQSGTLLGMIRHTPGGIIPWDDDVDLAYVKTDDDIAIKSLANVFRSNGLSLQRNRTDKYWQIGYNTAGSIISKAHVDLFSYSEKIIDGKKIFVIDDPRFENEDPNSDYAHCNIKYKHSELFPLDISHKFYEIIIPVPAKSEKVLARSLGKTYKNIAKIRDNSQIVEYKIVDYYPA
jgi:histidinol-phosphate aminotransferase